MSQMTDYLEGEQIKGLFRSHGVTAWAAATPYSLGQRVYATNVYGPFVFECVTAGTSGGAQPAWNTGLGQNTNDNTAVFKCLHFGVPKRPVYVGLYTAAPGEAGGGTECAGGSYARAQLDPADANWNAPSGGNGLTDNAAAINFPTPTASWGQATHCALHDQASGGNMSFYGALANPKNINNGDPAPSFPIGALDITFA